MSDDYDSQAAGSLDSLAALERQRINERKNIAKIKSAYKRDRFHTYRERRNFLKRLRAAERRYKQILAEILQLKNNTKYDLYEAQEAKRKSGVNVIVEISLDGVVFSNPAPKIANNARIWVRAKIDEAHRGDVGIPKTHELVHVTWSYSKVYTKLDTIPSGGHDEYFVSFPLVLTREFRAPASGSTKKNFIVYVDVYERIDD